jgi:Ca2+-binding EF-hand superfamily protein
MRKFLTLSFAAATAVLAAGAAYAQPAPRAEAGRAGSTRAEVEQRTAERFGRMDANDDGVLNEADRAAARRQAFDAIDADKDGTISFAEFEARRDEHREARTERSGSDGSRERGFARRGGRGGAGMTRGADADNDGTVTEAEFTTAALTRFDRADADKDGTISAEERRNARHHSPRGKRSDQPARDAG